MTRFISKSLINIYDMIFFSFFFLLLFWDKASVRSLPRLASNHDPSASASRMLGSQVCIIILAVEQFKYLTSTLQRQQEVVIFCALQKEAPFSFRSICFCYTQCWNPWCNTGQGRRISEERLCLRACGWLQKSDQARWGDQICQSASKHCPSTWGDVFAVGKEGRNGGRDRGKEERKEEKETVNSLIWH